MGLDAVDWILELEAVFGIKITDEAFARMFTIGATCDYIVTQVDPAVWPRERVESTVLDMAHDHFGVARHKITMASSYVDDLHAG